ncbi:MAG: BMC domain-containing protein [Chloroflexi bacterium]|nr:BMC domain-containing protein [Chloroflexota bacterium]
MSDVALGLLEFDSIAIGIAAGDAMVKRAPVEAIRAGTVQPGKYLVMVSGEVADVQESLEAGRAVGATALKAEVFLPQVHRSVVHALAGHRRAGAGAALGVIETRTAAACIGAADRGVKGAMVELQELRIADGLGGKAFLLFVGDVADVEAAVELGAETIKPPDQLVQKIVIASFHPEMGANLIADTRFNARVRGEASW